MKTNKTKFITKIISCFLCTAITLQAGLALTGEKVNAERYETSGLLLWMDNKIYKHIDDGTTFGTEEELCAASDQNTIWHSGNMLEVEGNANGSLGAFKTVNDGGEHRLNLQPDGSVTIASIIMSNSSDEILHLT